MLWDPLNVWPKGRRWIWAALAAMACLFQGPQFIRSLRPPGDVGGDFFQEWSSGRNYFCGAPIYMDLKLAIERYLGFQISENGKQGVRVELEVNAHPPTSVLVTLPLAMLAYRDAVLVWNLVSLGALFTSFWIIGRELAIPFSAWSVFPLVVLLLICNPFRQQVLQGQLNLLLLLLLTACWAAQRRNRPGWSGILLGIATAIKLFPGFLFFYFVLRRQWKTLMAGIIALAVLTGLTVSILGVETYKSYGMDVVPRVAVFRTNWVNASLPGLWTKLFVPDTEREHFHSFDMRIEPLWRSPALARLGTWLSCSLVVTVLAWLVWRARSRVESDLAFGLTIIAMLLVSPITWDHYLLLLTIPLAVMWTRLPQSNLVRTLFLITLIPIWMEYLPLFDALIPGGYKHGIAYPIHTICLLSYQCYALLMLFALIAAMSLPKSAPAPLRGEERSPQEYANTAQRRLNLEIAYNESSCGY